MQTAMVPDGGDMHTCSPRILEAEAGRLGIPG